MPNSDSASTTAFITAGSEPAQPALRRTLWRRGDWCAPAPDGFEAKRRQVHGARQTVIHERSGQQLPVFVVDHVFQQRLPDALSDAAVRLARDQHRINQHAEVIYGRVADDLDDAGFGVQFDFRDVAFPFRKMPRARL